MVFPRTCPCIGSSPPGSSRSQNTRRSLTHGRHTLSTAVIQASVCMAVRDILSESTLASESISAHPELLVVIGIWLLHHDPKNLLSIIKHKRSPGLLPACAMFKSQQQPKKKREKYSARHQTNSSSNQASGASSHRLAPVFLKDFWEMSACWNTPTAFFPPYRSLPPQNTQRALAPKPHQAPCLVNLGEALVIKCCTAFPWGQQPWLH